MATLQFRDSTPGWLKDHFLLSGLSARVLESHKQKNGRLASLASNPLVTVPILEM